MVAPEAEGKMEVDVQGTDTPAVKTDIDQEKARADVAALVALATGGQQQQAIDGLLAIEKVGRLAEDIGSTKMACTAVLEVRFSAARPPPRELHADPTRLRWRCT
jgi:hypothetical protein